MTSFQTEEQKILLAAKAIANSQAFPRPKNSGRGMNYEQYLIGQVISGYLPTKETDGELLPEFVAKTAIMIASNTIIELAKQQMVNEDD